MPVCSSCHTDRPPEEFYVARNRTSGRQSWCKPCMNAKAKAWQKANPEKVRQHDRRKTLRARYGAEGPELYERLFALQRGRCAICGGTEKVRQRANSEIQHFAMDHDARTGKVRGLLCFACNRALGVAGDNLDRVMRLVRYLESPPVSRLS